MQITQMPRVLPRLSGWGEQTQPKACDVGPFSTLCAHWLDEMSGMFSQSPCILLALTLPSALNQGRFLQEGLPDR